MAKVIKANFTNGSKVIDSKAVKRRVAVAPGLLAPAVEEISRPLAGEHTSDPIKKLSDINRCCEYFLEREMYMEHMLFICGINFGLRVSDLITLRFCDLIDDSMTFRTTFPILEKKTSHTRKVPKNRYVTINDAVVDAVLLYLEHTEGVSLSDYMFGGTSLDENGRRKPVHRNTVENILKRMNKELGLGIHVATHTLRKTFGYHQMAMSGNDPRKLLLLQKIYGHSSMAQTLTYIGITDEEVEEAYMQLNLGSPYSYIMETKIVDTATSAPSA